MDILLRQVVEWDGWDGMDVLILAQFDDIIVIPDPGDF